VLHIFTFFRILTLVLDIKPLIRIYLRPLGVELNMKKVVVKILQSSVVTQTVLGGLTIYLPIANFQYSIYLYIPTKI